MTPRRCHVLTMLVWLAATSHAGADTLAQTLAESGLLGSWSVDCTLPPDHQQGARLGYEIKPDGRAVYRRDFGDRKDENEIVAASVDPDGLITLLVFFPSLHQTREFGVMIQRDDTLRAVFNRDQSGHYTIRDGLFLATGSPTPAQHRCSGANS